MLINSFMQGFTESLCHRMDEVSSNCVLYLLVDGAFVNGIHRLVSEDKKRIFFEKFPSCGDETKAVSPFLVKFDPDDRKQRNLLDRCNGWPMVSVIETPESFDELFGRLATWCIVEAEGSLFNFRFADTRRLPTIVRVLTNEQKKCFLGSTKRWSYIGRDGKWNDLNLRLEYESVIPDETLVPSLTNSQFGTLVEDSRADELLATMAYRGDHPQCTYFQRWKSICMALTVAAAAGLDDPVADAWAIWFVKNNYSDDKAAAKDALSQWLKDELASNDTVANI